MVWLDSLESSQLPFFGKGKGGLWVFCIYQRIYLPKHRRITLWLYYNNLYSTTHIRIFTERTDVIIIYSYHTSDYSNYSDPPTHMVFFWHLPTLTGLYYIEVLGISKNNLSSRFYITPSSVPQKNEVKIILIAWDIPTNINIWHSPFVWRLESLRSEA